MARLSDEELAAIAARLARAEDEPQFIAQTRADVLTLLEEVRDLRERETALLEIARSVAAMPNIAFKGKRNLCIACGRDADDHRPDCFREKARTLLGITPHASPASRA